MIRLRPKYTWPYQEALGMSDDTALIYRVPAMHCGHCKAAVTQEVQRVPGVELVDVDLDAKLVRITGADVDPGSVVAAIDEAGYEAEAA
jgi:copper chaperone